MKIKLLMAILALVGFAAGVSAQDPGAPDSVVVSCGHYPDVASGDSMVVVVVHFAVHDDAVRQCSGSYGWDFEGFEMDSARWTPEGAAAFPVFPLVWSHHNIDSTNFYNRFQVTGFGLGAADIVASADICIFYGHVNTWTEGDTINITPDPWVSAAFVTPSDLEFAPTWGGDATIAASDCSAGFGTIVCGDTDNNGELNEADLQRAIDSYLGVSNDWPCPVIAWDMDCDGVITIADIVMLAGYIHGHGPTPCCAPPPKRPDRPGVGKDRVPPSIDRESRPPGQTHGSGLGIPRLYSWRLYRQNPGPLPLSIPVLTDPLTQRNETIIDNYKEIFAYSKY